MTGDVLAGCGEGCMIAGFRERNGHAGGGYELSEVGSEGY